MSVVSRTLRIVLALAAAAVLAGCAHPISLNTDAAPPQRVDAHLVQKKVAYAMTEADRSKQAITPGGGGDRISYYPYRDLEKSIRDALRAVYQDVVVINSAADANAVKASGASFVFTPVITTNSSSSSVLTWPPTDFSTEIACTVTDSAGVEVTRVKATGKGAAEFSEFKHDLALSAKRASADVANQLASEIRRNEKLR
ncbi:hypothetical protein NU688_22775 [Variovorax sp. ZS18.2.2]|uniref:hypothetical protein n=1 Tax=Variovorax sp. ZS18.2.2 TaxID=2971255 RepID=UPI002150D4E6|nr:hypothetical protein [Variovorax sp. ZS18.2.2]MCR6479000.1 hypothetical protein [Variovorax sp. ZS18.2.2]